MKFIQQALKIKLRNDEEKVFDLILIHARR